MVQLITCTCTWYLVGSSWRSVGRFRGPCGRHALARYISVGGSAAGRWLLHAPWLQLPREGIQKLLLLLKHGCSECSQCRADAWLIPSILAFVCIPSRLPPRALRPGRWWIIGLSLWGDPLRPGLWHTANDNSNRENSLLLYLHLYMIMQYNAMIFFFCKSKQNPKLNT